MSDIITVTRSRYLQLAKRIHADGRIEAYGNARTVDFFEMPVADLDAIHKLLLQLLPRSNCAVVFGGIADPNRTRAVRRLAYPDPDTGDLATVRAVPHQWCALDCDGVEKPDSIPAHDLARCGAEAVRRLPNTFRDTRCIVQASASHGIKPGCRLRLWFWLSRPTTGVELDFWLKASPVDLCTFRPAQLIYTAAPIFVGRPDHLPHRIAQIDGASCVSVPQPERLQSPLPKLFDINSHRETTDGDVTAFIVDLVARVRSAPDGSKHTTLRNVAMIMGGIQDKARFSDVAASQWLINALPGTTLDLKLAQKTVEWGLDIGRAKPISVPRREPDKPPGPDPRRKDTARAAFRLLRMGVPSVELLATLHELNGRRDKPLPANVIGETAVWAASQPKVGAHAR